MNAIKTRITVMCISLIVMGLLIIVPGYGRIDPESAVGIWLFDEGSGKIARDSSGKDNDGDIMGKPKWLNGKFGQALEFGEESNWVQIKDNPTLRVSDMYTVMAWIKAERHFFPGTQWQGIIAKANNPRSYSFYTDDSKQFLIAIHFGGQHIVGMSGAQVPLEEWTHVAVVVETGKEGGKMRLFTDGKLTKETPNAGLKGLPGDSDTKDVVIGRTWEGARFFGGLIDEVALLKAVLTEDDISEIANKGLSRTLGITSVETAGKLTTTWATIKSRY